MYPARNQLILRSSSNISPLSAAIQLSVRSAHTAVQRLGGSLSRARPLGFALGYIINRTNSHYGLPMITSLEKVTDAEEFQSYLDWITIEFDEDRMDGAEAQRRLLEARRFLFELRPDLRDQYSAMTNQ
jgi:hypothetical protein